MTDGLAFHALGEARAAIRRNAEREMQPYLGRVLEANGEARRLSLYTPPEEWARVLREQLAASEAALTKALDLLGVRS